MINKMTSGLMVTLIVTGMLLSISSVYFVESGLVSDLASQNSIPPYTQWNKTYGETGTQVGYSTIQTNEGGYAIAGSIEQGNSNDFLLIKTSSEGDFQWSKTYGGPDSEVAYSVVQTKDGGYALTGFTRSYGAGDIDSWLVKTDSSGTLQWSKTYGGIAHDQAESVVQTDDGGYAIAGYTESSGNDGGDFWLVKTDSDGEVLWDKTYGGTEADYAYALVKTTDGGYALAGLTISFGAGDQDFGW